MSLKEQVKQQKSIGNEDSIININENEELLLFLLKNLAGKNRNNIKTLLRSKQIFINNQLVTQFNYVVKPGDTLTVKWNRGKFVSSVCGKGVRIIFEDNVIITVEKQAGVLSISTEKEKKETVFHYLSEHVKKTNPKAKIFVVHRLDRDTSGLMLFAKNQDIKLQLQQTWENTIIERTYIALVEGKIEEKQGTIVSYLKETTALMVYSSQNPEHGLKSITHFKTIKSNKDFTLLEVNLETGRKNQIRVHMNDIGHSIVGDKKYGSTCNPIKRLGLHAKVLAFIHPLTKEKMRFDSEIPSSFLKFF